MPMLPAFCAPSSPARSPAVSAERTINYYIEQSPNDKNQYTLYSFPGLLPVATLPSGPVRGLYEATNGRVFAVTSTTLFEVFAGWTFLSRGTVTTGTTPASLTDDGTTLVLSVNGLGYAMPFATNVLAPLPLTGPQTFGRVQYLDGRIVTNEPGTRHFWFSDLLNATSWPALNFYAAEARADLLLTLLVDHRELWLFGSQSIEVWTSTGNSLNPFARSSAIFLEQGIAVPWAVHALDNTLFWLGGSPRGDGPVWSARGYEPVRVSTHAVESALSTVGSVQDSIAFVARHGGHAWYFLYVPGLATTWAYDTALQSWTELAELLDDGSLEPFRCWTHAMAFGEHVWGDRGTGQLYLWDPGHYYYGDRPIYRERISPHVRQDQQPVVYSLFELLVDSGVGLDGGAVPGMDPQVMLSWSDDGGHAFRTALWRSLGTIGEGRHLVRWRRLGRAKSQRCFRVVVTDPVPVSILGARVEVNGG
jgi:hypothetical protein